MPSFFDKAGYEGWCMNRPDKTGAKARPINPHRAPRTLWTDDERELDVIVAMMDSSDQVLRIRGCSAWVVFEKRFTKEQLAAMWLRMTGAKV